MPLLCWKIQIEGLQIFIWKPDLKASGHLTGLFNRSMGGHLANIGKHGGESRGFFQNLQMEDRKALFELLFIRRKMSGIECCFVRFYAVSADCTDRITLDEIDKNRWTGDLIRT